MIRRLHRRLRPARGFTLMEVLLVLAILVILGSFVTVGYVRVQEGAKKDSARTQVALLEDATNLYLLAVGSPPTSLQALIERPSDIAVPEKWNGPYLEKTRLPLDPWNHDYIYETYESADGMKFRISSAGPNGQPGDDDDIATSE
jgi:general secretion pathway protein G